MAKNPIPPERLQLLYRMLFEMATGNLRYRPPSTSKSDALDELFRLLAELAYRMQSTTHKFGQVTPHYHYQNLVQLTLITNNQFTILTCSPDTFNVIGWQPKLLRGIPFSMLIADQSLPLWHTIQIKAGNDPHYHSTENLIFTTPNQLLIPSFCTVSRLLYDDKIIISFITTSLNAMIYSLDEIKSKAKPRVSEAETMEQLFQYIMGNLGEPLPTIRQLARKFKVNEFDLKEGFRKLYHTSIHHFYNEERLKRAHLMIMQTDDSLKFIAAANGYQAYTSFNKAFRQRFGYPPSSLKRKSSE